MVRNRRQLVVKKEKLYDVYVAASWLPNHATIHAQNVTKEQGKAIKKLMFSFTGGYIANGWFLDMPKEANAD